MKRFFCLYLVFLAALAGCQVQDKKEPPKRITNAHAEDKKATPKEITSDRTQDKTAPPKHYTNSQGMKFVWIPPGSFLMGSPKEEKGRQDDETQHKVTLTKGFYMSVYTVTKEQWKAVMGNTPSP